MMDAHLGKRQLIAWFDSHGNFWPQNFASTASATPILVHILYTIKKKTIFSII